MKKILISDYDGTFYQNDIDMIRKYNGYRVKNACDELKSITSKVVDSVNCLISEII